MRSRRRLMLLAAALLTPLQGGCSAIPGWPTGTPATSAAADGQADGESWVVVTQGGATPSATTRGVAPSPTADPSSGALPVPAATPTPAPEPSCTGVQRHGQVNGLTAVPGAGSAAVSWYNPGGDNLVSYRLTAIAQDLVAGTQAPLTWQSISPESSCGMMSATVTGLDAGEPYVLSLDAVLQRNNADGGVGFTVARSGVIRPT